MEYEVREIWPTPYSLITHNFLAQKARTQLQRACKNYP